jgi:hypothetical protein
MASGRGKDGYRTMSTFAGHVGVRKALGIALGLYVSACCVVLSVFLAFKLAAHFRIAPLERGLVWIAAFTIAVFNQHRRLAI